MKFGIYFIPTNGNFYQLGSQLLGYDIRQGKQVPHPPWFDSSWAGVAQQYGFHVTLTDAVEISPSCLPHIEDKLEALLGCFSPQNKYVLSKDAQPISFWPSEPSQVAVLQLKPDPQVLMLHTALVCYIQVEGKGSLYSETFKNEHHLLMKIPYKAKRIELFHGPYLFDDFVPHFTLCNPYMGHNKAQVLEQLNEWFGNSNEQIEITSLCLVVQDQPEDNFRIYKEFPLTGRSI